MNVLPRTRGRAPLFDSPSLLKAISRLARFLLLPAIFAAGCAHRNPAVPSDLAQRRAATSTVIAPGDLVRITFRRLPDLNQTQRVRPDGRLTLLQVGTVTAGGKSLESFQRELARRYELKDEGDLIVSLESTYNAVYVTGAVGTPGKVILDRPMTVLEAIMESGGFDRATANLKRVTLTRMVQGKYQTYHLDMRMPDSGAIHVRPSDMIEVPRYFH